jgi:ribonuclease D
MDQPDFLFIQQHDELVDFCKRFTNCDWVALDTEFIREKTYYPQLCLVQIATPCGAVACVDTITIDDLSPLTALLVDARVRKILHAGSQDMEIFCSLCKRAPVNVFDTQIAAPLFGYPEQMGYAALVEKRLGVSLSKSQSRTDWAVRPLSNRQLRYAADDVIYLARLFPEMYGELQKKQRLDWLRDDFEVLCDIETYQKADRDAWQRIRGVEKLGVQSLAMAQALAEWREHTARKRNLPRNWILKDDSIIGIARLNPGSEKDLESLRGVKQSTIAKYAGTLLEICSEAKTRQPEPLTKALRKRKLTRHEDALVDLLSAVAKLYAEQHDINHTVLAPRKELEKLVVEQSQSRVLIGWRKQFVGLPLQRLLNGELSLSVDHSGRINLLKIPED